MWNKKEIILSYLILLTLAVSNSFVFMYMWNWYIPNLLNLNSINIMQSFGLVMFFVIIKKIIIPKRREYENWNAIVIEFYNTLLVIYICFSAAFLTHFAI